MVDLENVPLDKDRLDKLKEKVCSNSVVGNIKWGELDKLEGNSAHGKLVEEIEDKIIKNNQDYKYHPTDFVHGLLSKHVYQDSGPGEKVIIEGNPEWKDKLKSDWKVYDVVNEFEKCGYYGVIYINESKKQLVIAHRGTSNLGGAKTDINEVLSKKIGPAIEKAYATVDRVIKLVKSGPDIKGSPNTKGFNVSVTGHSLGGYFSALSAFFAYKKEYVVKGVIFDSPGTGAMMEQLSSNVVNIRNNKTECATF